MLRTAAFLLLLAALIAPPALAFHRHLSPAQVRDAYQIGRDRNHRDSFFAAYIHAPRVPGAGPDVASIEFRTPYVEVALRARDNQWTNDSPSEAQKYYDAHSGQVIVRVLIYETSSFNFPATDAKPDTAGFQFRVSQDRRSIPYNKVTVDDATPIGAGSGPGGDGGIDVRLAFDISQFESDHPVTVTVLAPTGQTYSTTFDLAHLE